MAEEFLTPREIAQMLKIPEDSVTRLLRIGEIPGYKIGGSWRVDRQDFQQYLAEKKNTQKKK